MGLVANGILSLDDEEPNLMNTNELFVFDSSSSKLTKSVFKGHEFHDLTDLFFKEWRSIYQPHFQKINYGKSDQIRKGMERSTDLGGILCLSP